MESNQHVIDWLNHWVEVVQNKSSDGSLKKATVYTALAMKAKAVWMELNQEGDENV